MLVEELPDELLLFDRPRNRAHCLNRAAAFVWRRCDGRRTVRELARLMSEEFAEPIGEDTVEAALGQLARAHLLEERAEGGRPSLSRRKMVRNLIVVPAVLTILAPSAAQAASCRPHNAPCSSNAQCCSLFCNPGTHLCK
jgi:hypothetical protein